MFKISRRADYATRIMLELGEAYGSGMVQSAKLAETADVPVAFLRKIVADLNRAGLVQSITGPNGGVSLAEKPSKINMLQILEAIEGNICLNICLLKPNNCPREKNCPAHDFWGRLQNMLIQELENARLDTLVEEARQKKAAGLTSGYLHPLLPIDLLGSEAG